ncbi:MAG: DnaD domain protein [Clostridia bacterium]|nr:DnaD domain protein [Clostridia bacterium]
MKIIPNYKNSVTVIPTHAILYFEEATADDIVVLLAVLRHGGSFDPSRICEELSMDGSTLDASLNFWAEKDVISVVEEDEADRLPGAKDKNEPEIVKIRGEVAKPRRKTLQRPDVPSYTAEETTSFMELNEETSALLDSCQQIIGKMFSTAETNIIIGLMDHLGLSEDYIGLLFAHAAKKDRRSVRYVEKLAIDLFDKGITEYSALVEELQSMEEADSRESMVRRIFGLGKRSLTGKEKGFVNNWCVEWNYGEDVIGIAYEITVANTNEASMPYANAILEKWHGKGLKTAAEVEKFVEDEKKKKSGGGKKGDKGAASSFDTDDFFEKALTRSYGDKKGKNGGK